MRIFALLSLGLALVGYRAFHSNDFHPPVAAANAQRQPAGLLVQSADGGQTWQDLGQGLPAGLTVNCIFSQDKTLYLGTENGLYSNRHPETGAWQREEFGELVRNDFGLLVLNKRVTGIFAGRSGPYVCIGGAGFYRRVPGSDQWQPMHTNLSDKNVFTVAEKTDGTLLVGCQTGVYRSKDDGATWQQLSTERWISNLTVIDDVLLISGHEGVMRSTDGGQHWTCVISDPGASYRTSTIDGGVAALRVAWRMNVQMPFLSTSYDGGLTWQSLGDGLQETKGFYEMQKVGDYLFCSHAAGVSRSADGGKTWELVRSAPPAEKDKPVRLEVAGWGKNVFMVQAWGGC